MKMTFIVPRDVFLDSDRVMPPLGVMALAAVMREEGWDTEIINDFNSMLLGMEALEDTDIFAISCTTPQWNEAKGIISSLKREFPRKEVIVGGPHATNYTTVVMNHAGVDRVVVGDGETALREISRGEALGNLICHPLSTADLEEQPLPLRERDFLSQYHYKVGGLPASTIITTRGCPMSCSFCESARTLLRYESIERVGRQIEQLTGLGYRAVMFFDDLFALSESRVKALTTEIAKHDIVYRCFGHASTMTESMAKMLRDSGCVEIGFGAESGSQKILDNVLKRTRVEDNIRFVDLMNSYGISVKAFLILGLPGEDHDTVQRTKDFIQYLMSRSPMNDCDICIFYPYKGSPIRAAIDGGYGYFDIKFVCDENLDTSFYKGRDGINFSAVETAVLTKYDLQRYQRELLRLKRRIQYERD